jgi:hypothetical protein
VKIKNPCAIMENEQCTFLCYSLVKTALYVGNQGVWKIENSDRMKRVLQLFTVLNIENVKFGLSDLQRIFGRRYIK